MPQSVGYGDAFIELGSGLQDLYRIRSNERQQRFQNLQQNAASMRAGEASNREAELQPGRIAMQAQNLKVGAQSLEAGAQNLEAGTQAMDAAERAEVQKAEAEETLSDALGVAVDHLDSNTKLAKSDWGKQAKTAITNRDLKSYYEAVRGYQNDLQKGFDRGSRSALADKTLAAKTSASASGGLPASLQKEKDKRTEKFITQFKSGQLAKTRFADAKLALDKFPTGLKGRATMRIKEIFQPNDPALAEWQKVKRVLTDAQLMNTAKTKGAISDKEMELFMKAAANDEIMSPAKIKLIMGALEDDIDTSLDASRVTYKNLYSEDPYTFVAESNQPAPAQNTNRMPLVPASIDKKAEFDALWGGGQ